MFIPLGTNSHQGAGQDEIYAMRRSSYPISMKLFTNLQIYTDQVYALDWDAPAFLDENGYQLDNKDQKGLNPMATLIGGRYGSWVRFITESAVGAMHNVKFWALAMGKKYRIMVRARKDIRCVEQTTTVREEVREDSKQGRDGQVQ
jgi:hypothetical protein